MILVKERDGNLDELFVDAIRVCAAFDFVAASLIQRKLRVGCAQAAKILDQLEYAGVVGQATSYL